MKKCPFCKKNIPDSAKVCPHCGNRLEKGYQPMKRTNAFPNYIYLILALILFFSPLVTTLMFGSLFDEEMMSTSQITTPEQAITLGPLQQADIESEIIEYQFNSLEELQKLVTNSQSYVTKIEDLEKQIQQIITDEVAIAKDYTFYITDTNNLYSDIKYSITVNDQDTIIVSLMYDLSGNVNQLEVTNNISGFTNFEDMKIDDQSCLLAKQLVTLYSNHDDFSCFDEAARQFNQLSLTDQTLGNYGLGTSSSNEDIKVAFRILGNEENYRFRLTYHDTIDLSKLV